MRLIHNVFDFSLLVHDSNIDVFMLRCYKFINI